MDATIEKTGRSDVLEEEKENTVPNLRWAHPFIIPVERFPHVLTQALKKKEQLSPVHYRLFSGVIYEEVTWHSM